MKNTFNPAASDYSGAAWTLPTQEVCINAGDGPHLAVDSLLCHRCRAQFHRTASDPCPVQKVGLSRLVPLRRDGRRDCEHQMLC
jgi:hypothetical protein